MKRLSNSVKIFHELSVIQGGVDQLAYLNLTPCSDEGGGGGWVYAHSKEWFVQLYPTGCMQWTKIQRTFTVKSYFGNGRSIIATNVHSVYISTLHPVAVFPVTSLPDIAAAILRHRGI